MKRIPLFILLILSKLIAVSQIPPGYYDSAAGFGGVGLKNALYNIIKGHKEYEYSSDTTDVWDILKETDRDTINPDNVICLYSGFTRDAAAEYNNGNGWTREHVWAKSHGQFDPDIFGPGAGTDIHHLRPADNSVNTERNNRWFAECSEEYIDPDGPTGSYESSTEWLWKPRDEVKGDVARMMFYMATRYEGENGEPDLELIDYIPADNNDPLPLHAKLSDLLAWNQQDPVDDYERNRNDIIYSYQHNRNPFIDHPEWAECIWNNACTGLWFTSYPDTLMTDREDYAYSVSASCSEAVVLTITSEISLPPWLTFTPVTSEISSATATLTGSPAFSDIGSYPIKLKVSDGSTDVYQNYTITVIDGNPITFTSIPVTDATVDEVYTYNITATGDNGANFTLTGTTLPPWLNLINNTGNAATLTGTPAAEHIGLNSVVLTLTDDTKKTITQEFDINVVSQSDANHLIISQYYEGLSNDKYIELTNTGTLDIDLSTYYLGRWGNTDTPSGVFTNGDPLSGTIGAGQTIIYKNASAVDPAYAANNAYGTTTATYYNGNDPVALLKDGTTWDDRVDCIYGSLAVNSYWGLDTGFYRKAFVLNGNKNISVFDGTGEWVPISIIQADTALVETSEYLGFHIFETVGIRALLSQTIRLFPNPAQDILHIESQHSIIKTELYTISGQLLKENSQLNIQSVSISNLKAGMYLIKLYDSTGTCSFLKFIKQ